MLVASCILILGTAGAHAAERKVFKVGILTTAMSPWHPDTEGFRKGLRELGYVEGHNLTFELRAARGDMTRLPQLAEELVREKPDLLYCVATSSARACQQATAVIPIVSAGIDDPVAAGLVGSLARPGGNLTGIANLRAELTAKRLQLFKELVPSLRRVLVTYDPREPDELEAVTVARNAAMRLDLTLIENPIISRLDIEPGLTQLEDGGPDGILIVQPAQNLDIPGRSLEVATSNGIPTMYPQQFWTRYGALASYGPDQTVQGYQAARLADRILKGMTPATLPFELPDTFEFVVNLKTAKRLGLRLPEPALLLVDTFIE